MDLRERTNDSALAGEVTVKQYAGILTEQKLAALPDDKVFAYGITFDNSQCLNYSGSNDKVFWVATKGGNNDFAVYGKKIEKGSVIEAMLEGSAFKMAAGHTKRHGDKSFSYGAIQELLDASSPAMARYRK